MVVTQGDVGPQDVAQLGDGVVVPGERRGALVHVVVPGERRGALVVDVVVPGERRGALVVDVVDVDHKDNLV